MRYSNERSFRAQFDFLRRQFLQDGELPFTDVLSRETVTQALDTIEDAWNEQYLHTAGNALGFSWSSP